MTTLPVPEVPQVLVQKVKEDIEFTIRAAEKKYFSASFIRETFVEDDIDNPKYQDGVKQVLSQLEKSHSVELFTLTIPVQLSFSKNNIKIHLQSVPVSWILTCTRNADDTLNYFYKTKYRLSREHIVQVLEADLGQALTEENVQQSYRVTFDQLERLLRQSPISSEYKQLDPVFVNYFLFAAEARKSRQTPSSEKM